MSPFFAPSETLSEYYNGTVGTGGEAGTKPFGNGFAALASSSLNTVADGVFNSSDAGWSTVRVWVDDNADGVSFKDVNGNGTYQPGRRAPRRHRSTLRGQGKWNHCYATLTNS